MKYVLASALLILPIYWLILQLVCMFVSATSKATQDQQSVTPVPTQFDLY